MKFLISIINGPNLNLLGRREKIIYGTFSLDEICERLKIEFGKFCDLEFFQSNSEGSIIDYVHSSKSDGFVMNLGAYSHTSYAIRDAICAVSRPVVEVHISNVLNRENFRHVSIIAPVCIGYVVGFREFGYNLGILALLDHMLNLG